MRKIIVISIMASFLVFAAAHSGGTDSNGGHYNRKTGEYHYHHGYSAHQHPGGVCPYSSSYSSSSRSSTTSKSTNTSSNTYYNNGYANGYKAGLTAGYNNGAKDAWNNGHAAGYKAGAKDGWNNGHAAGYKAGVSEGYENGSKEGWNNGYASGFDKGQAEAVPIANDESIVEVSNEKTQPIESNSNDLRSYQIACSFLVILGAIFLILAIYYYSKWRRANGTKDEHSITSDYNIP